MKHTALAFLLLLSACSREGMPANNAELYQTNAIALTPGVRPVRIGEGGPAFRACASIGEVVNLSPTGERYLPLRAAPFAEADEVAQLNEGSTLFLCPRPMPRPAIAASPRRLPDRAPMTAPAGRAGS